MSEKMEELVKPETLKALTERHGKYLDQLRQFKVRSAIYYLLFALVSNSRLSFTFCKTKRYLICYETYHFLKVYQPNAR